MVLKRDAEGTVKCAENAKVAVYAQVRAADAAKREGLGEPSVECCVCMVMCVQLAGGG